LFTQKVLEKTKKNQAPLRADDKG